MFTTDGDRQRAIYKNKITIRADVDNKIIDIKLINVYYVPSFNINLVSYKKLKIKGVWIEEREQLTLLKKIILFVILINSTVYSLYGWRRYRSTLFK